MQPLKIIQKYYEVGSKSYEILVAHSELVTKKALEIAKKVPHLNPGLKFIEEAAMLHDIGIFLTNFPDIGCFGEYPYICHGYLGREILEKEGFPLHALVCDRHTGVGLSIEDIEGRKLPIPKRDMQPISIEEQIICFADKFYSKRVDSLLKEKSLEEVRNDLKKFGDDNVGKFNGWVEKFGG